MVLLRQIFFKQKIIAKNEWNKSYKVMLTSFTERFSMSTFLLQNTVKTWFIVRTLNG